MSSRVHDATAGYWDNALAFSLNQLITIWLQEGPPGCEPLRTQCALQPVQNQCPFTYLSTPAFTFGSMKKQADGGVRSTGSDYPSMVLDVRSSESLSQLRIDAQLWLEHKLCEIFLLLFFFLSLKNSKGKPQARRPDMYRPTSFPQHHSSNQLPTMATQRSHSTLRLISKGSYKSSRMTTGL